MLCDNTFMKELQIKVVIFVKLCVLVIIQELSSLSKLKQPTGIVPFRLFLIPQFTVFFDFNLVFG